MIVLDENIPRDEWRILSHWRIRSQQIGFELATKGVDDQEQIIPLLRRLQRPIFFTRDLGFYEPGSCDPRYCVVCLAVRRNESSLYIRRILRHPRFRRHRDRAGMVVWVSHDIIRVLRKNSIEMAVRWLER